MICGQLLAKHGLPGSGIVETCLRLLPWEEVKVGAQILAALGLRPRTLEIVSCPSRGRARVDVHTLANKVRAAVGGFPHPLRVAVMGCVVNGPDEAREADLGVSSVNGKSQIFVRAGWSGLSLSTRSSRH